MGKGPQVHVQFIANLSSRQPGQEAKAESETMNPAIMLGRELARRTAGGDI
jgi:hypothetical protein